MNLTIKLTPSTQIALENEAAARNLTREQTASEVIETFFCLHGVREEGYEEWFRAQVEEGFDDIRNGRFASNEEVERSFRERRLRLLSKLKNEQ